MLHAATLHTLRYMPCYMLLRYMLHAADATLRYVTRCRYMLHATCYMLRYVAATPLPAATSIRSITLHAAALRCMRYAYYMLLRCMLHAVKRRNEKTQ
jgi:hypothetical protein